MNRFAWNSNVLFKIASRSARDIRRLATSFFKDLPENEVVFLPGSKFRIISVEMKDFRDCRRPFVTLEQLE